MQIPVYICDDILELTEQYKKIIESTITMEEYPMTVAGCFTTPKQLIDAVRKHTAQGIDYGIYFLDIDLACDTDGFSLAKRIREIDSRGFIIFITTHGNLAVETFRQQIEAMDFILKDDFDLLRQRIKECLKIAYERRSAVKQNQIISLSDKNRQIFYNENDILYITAAKKPHHIIIFTTDGQDIFRGSLNNIKENLSNSFVLCHRSYIVNKNHIKSVDFVRKEILLSNRTVIPVSSNGLSSVSS